MNASVAFLVLVAALSAALITSGVGKLRSSTSTEELESLGVPAWMRHRALVAAHPWVEIASGIGLLVASGWLLVTIAIGTVALTVFYAALISRAVRTGSAKTCRCFGDLFDAQLTWRSVVRNAVLVLLALAVLAGALMGESALGIVSSDPATLLPVLAAALVGVGVWTTVSRPADELPEDGLIGPAFSGVDEYRRFLIPMAWLKDPSDRPMTLRELARAQARLLIFLSPGCHACKSLVDDIPGWVEEFPMLGVHVVFSEDKADVSELMPAMLPYAMWDEGADALRALDVGGFPSAVLLGMDGLLAGGPVVGPGAVRALVDQLRDEFAEDGAAGEDGEEAQVGQFVDVPSQAP